MMKWKKEKYVHYGCGLTAPLEGDNYDISPTLRIQKAPVVGKILSSKLNIRFPGSVKYGDIVSGLPVGSERIFRAPKISCCVGSPFLSSALHVLAHSEAASFAIDGTASGSRKGLGAPALFRNG
jgi:hypothetical protein